MFSEAHPKAHLRSPSRTRPDLAEKIGPVIDPRGPLCRASLLISHGVPIGLLSYVKAATSEKPDEDCFPAVSKIFWKLHLQKKG